jgi:hypothetical protein
VFSAPVERLEGLEEKRSMLALLTLVLVGITAVLGFYHASPMMIPIMGLLYTPIYIYKKKASFALYAQKGPFSVVMGVGVALINECLVAALIFYVAMAASGSFG